MRVKVKVCVCVLAAAILTFITLVAVVHFFSRPTGRKTERTFSKRPDRPFQNAVPSRVQSREILGDSNKMDIVLKPAQSEEVGDKLVVSSYNLRIDIDPYPNDWETRRDLVKEALQFAQPAVLCLQEANCFTADFVKKQLPGYQMVGATRQPWRGSEFCPILFDPSVLRLLRTRTQIMSVDSSSWRCNDRFCKGTSRMPAGETTKHPRIFTHAQFHFASGQLLDVINTHFPLASAHRRVCCGIIASYIDAEVDASSFLIVAGDLNTNDERPEEELESLLRGANLSDSCGLADFPTFGPLSDLGVSGHRLDYILHREGSSSKLVKSASYCMDYRRADPFTIRASDHLLQTTMFWIRKAKTTRMVPLQT